MAVATGLGNFDFLSNEERKLVIPMKLFLSLLRQTGSGFGSPGVAGQPIPSLGSEREKPLVFESMEAWTPGEILEV